MSISFASFTQTFERKIESLTNVTVCFRINSGIHTKLDLNLGPVLIRNICRLVKNIAKMTRM